MRTALAIAIPYIVLALATGALFAITYHAGV